MTSIDFAEEQIVFTGSHSFTKFAPIPGPAGIMFGVSGPDYGLAVFS